MIARIRFLMHRMNLSQNMFTRSYYILKYGIMNIYKYCREHRMIEVNYKSKKFISYTKIYKKEGEEKELIALDS
jgi:hypothetical protein